MFLSKHNQVYPIRRGECLAVEKHFAELSDWAHECTLLRQFRSFSGCARLLSSKPGVTVTRWYPGGTVLDELVRQEYQGFAPGVWTALADWIAECHRNCGFLPRDCNLCNFLWSEGKIIGIDLESYAPLSPAQCAAGIIAGLWHYHPVGSPVKEQASAVLKQQTGVSATLIHSAEQALLQRRAARKHPAVSGIILAGGCSSRMGRDKSRLLLGDETILQRQIRKLRAIGITDILISGSGAPEDTRAIPDIFPGRGPLGEIHACLQSAENPHCLVLSVDVPLVPAAMLNHLCRMHRAGITVLSHHGRSEPLVGVYDQNLSEVIGSLTARQGVPVRQPAKPADWNALPYLGPPEYLRSCNTPQDYSHIQEILDFFSRKGLDFL